ncbi:phage repressor protein CI [Vibrio sp. SCSIO 43169]|uniref:phage repressor protein CI n=1 Tax=Vibrio sp. SCSIO 43169 TaxID=2822801 RepID=UPI0020448483|nr:phage repressor protein CI [Vibrio sp. SCSIO 43169]MCM5509786.1 phage repressor protein CI [Vibrio sp. SCSIO 43169]
MREKQANLSAFDYQGGKLVTERLCKALDAKNLSELSSILNIPTSTMSTWHKRELCPYEVVLRAHMYTGVSVRWLTLGEGEPFPNRGDQEDSNLIFDIDSYKILNGELISQKPLTLDTSILGDTSVLNVMAVFDSDCTYVIDRDTRKAVSGTYLVDMDGLFSLNKIQRLPGKKLAISFNGSTLTVEEDEVKVVGRVALVMEKK